MVGCASTEEEKYGQEIAPVAEDFLKLLDNGEYQSAFEKFLNPIVNDAIKAQNWFADYPGSKGKVVTRKWWGVRHKTKFPGNYPEKADGDYLQSVYQTKFESGGELFSEIILVSKENGAWKMASYGIQKWVWGQCPPGGC
jgi:hypothetical protein